MVQLSHGRAGAGPAVPSRGHPGPEAADRGRLQAIKARLALATQVDATELTAYGPCREVYLESPTGDADAGVTELRQPVR
ncbi:hypothetical protein ASE25_13665 [Terrabacter sp. Root85]|nr:hypothetical protein ASE25_13665 [Terrabacter sp. Root85]